MTSVAGAGPRGGEVTQVGRHTRFSGTARRTPAAGTFEAERQRGEPGGTQGRDAVGSRPAAISALMEM